MLYEFNFFWKLITTLSLSWIAYFVFGFELTVVTLMALLIVAQNRGK